MARNDPHEVVMCNAEIVGTGLPAGSFELLQRTMAEFMADQSSWEKFEAAEWAALQFSVKMSSYATARRCAAGAKWRPTVAPPPGR